jgi:hypothetical protein
MCFIAREDESLTVFGQLRRAAGVRTTTHGQSGRRVRASQAAGDRQFEILSGQGSRVVWRWGLFSLCLS